MGTESDASEKSELNEALLTKVSGELDAAEKAIEGSDLALAETLLENAAEHLASAGADPTARASYRPPAPGAPAPVGTLGATNPAAKLIGADEMTRYDFLQLKFAFRTGRIPPAVALTRLVRLLQQKKDLAGGREFYGELSKAAYADRSSNLAHSHPPPPAEPKD